MPSYTTLLWHVYINNPNLEPEKMTEKTVLTLPIDCASSADLRAALLRQQERGFLTCNQVLAILTICAARLPATVSIYQRTPKGTTYVHINNELAYSVNQSAQVRQHNGDEAPNVPTFSLPSRANYAFSSLKPGQSITVTRADANELRNARGAAFRAAQYYGWRISTCKTAEGLKVQRIT